jgi:hypothetical protein
VHIGDAAREPGTGTGTFFFVTPRRPGGALDYAKENKNSQAVLITTSFIPKLVPYFRSNDTLRGKSELARKWAGDVMRLEVISVVCDIVFVSLRSLQDNSCGWLCASIVLGWRQQQIPLLVQ